MNLQLFGMTASNRILICSFFAAPARARRAAVSPMCSGTPRDRTLRIRRRVFSLPDSISWAVTHCNRDGPMDTAPVFTALLTCVAWDRLRGDRDQVAWNQFMTGKTKIATILLCFFLCRTGTYLASTVYEKREPQKINAIPVKNRDVVRRIWIQV